jgi:hypothetical protein
MVRGITNPVDRYCVVTAAPSEQQSELVSNIPEEEPTEDSYQLLKAALLSSHTLTPYQMVDKLVNLEPLGGHKTSELMAVMQKLRPPKDEHSFIYHFLQCLPKEVRILLTHDNFSDTRKLAEKTDGLMAIHQPHAPDLTAIAAATADLVVTEQETVAAAASRAAGRGRGSQKRNRGGNRRRSRSPADFLQSPLCFYHIRYGAMCVAGKLASRDGVNAVHCPGAHTDNVFLSWQKRFRNKAAEL